VLADPSESDIMQPRRRPGRSNTWVFDRLALKLASGVALLVIVPLGAGFLALEHNQYERTIAARQIAAELQIRMLEVALRHQMVDKDPRLMTRTLLEVAAHPDVNAAMILDHHGEVRIASDPERVGERLERDAPECMVCHEHEPADRGRVARIESAGGDVLRTVLPIENAPECHGCHAPTERLNGIMILDISLAGVHAALARDVAWFAIAGSLLALLLVGGTGLLVRRLVLVRLARLRHTARAIAAGNLHERAVVGGHDVITALAVDFNTMAVSLESLLERFRQQEARLTNIVNSLDDGLVVLDSDSRVVACNRSFARRIGHPPDDVRGQVCHVVGAEALPCCRGENDCPAERCMRTGEVQRAVFPLSADATDEGPIAEVYASPVFDDQGRVAQVVEIWRDITERVREEQRLAEIERLVSLGALASGFSHEVNTPLATMLTCADSVLGRLSETPRRTPPGELLEAAGEAAEIIREQVLRCRRITEQFLRFARGVPPSTEPFDLRRELMEVVALVRPTAREDGLDIRVEGDEPLPPVRANTEVVRHVFLNLLVNAVQSCETGGGTIGVSFAVGDDVRVCIRDPGCGISPEDRRHLFAPFHSRKPQGTGLGLFLSRTFMRRFDGDVILAETAVGGGSCFHVVFARAKVDAP